MGQSLVQVYVHITFSTRNRLNLIDKNIENTLSKYLGGVCSGLGCTPVQIGGYRNHVHILCMLSKKITIEQLLEELKKRSSKWIKNQERQYSNFYWQYGYGIFSVNYFDIDKVIRYIQNQEEHHKKISFIKEFKALLKKYQVKYDERYFLG
ncbi:MAG: IS200/IS605 family transposase [Melioribacteraceae bacterium]|nr:IS200/IS605 family transposase [Melioribacteraceae bacterium]